MQRKVAGSVAGAAILAALALSAVALAYALSAGGSPTVALPLARPAAVHLPQKPSYLFSIPAASGSLRGPNDKHLTLKLIGTRNYLTRFTDRPIREAFVVANVDFERRFPGYFGTSPPNAVLTYTPPGSRLPVSIVLVVGRPHWDRATATWTMSAQRIRKKTDNLPDTTVHIKPPLIPNPRSFGHGTLFIDDSGSGCSDYPPGAAIPTFVDVAVSGSVSCEDALDPLRVAAADCVQSDACAPPGFTADQWDVVYEGGLLTACLVNDSSSCVTADYGVNLG
jgi:hypothetical protein